MTTVTTKILDILHKFLKSFLKSAKHEFNPTAPAGVNGNNFKLLLASIEQFNFETLKILKYGFNTTLHLIYWAYKPCRSELCF